MTALSTDRIVAVIGAGTMGAGIAQVAAQAGHPVLLYDAQDGAAARGRDGIAAFLAKSVERGKIDENDRKAILDRLTVADNLKDLSPAGMVIEAIVENLEIKQNVFKDLEELCGDDTILASNTSSLSITAIGAALERPGRLVGMHFFNPAPLMALVEVIHGLMTDTKAAETVFDTAAAWGKAPVHATSTPGFIVNRCARGFYGEALRVYQEGGADPATVDAVMREAGGFRMGPFELMDLIGNDINVAVSTAVFAAYHNDPRFMPSLAQKELAAAGRLGRKSGAGWYDYGEGAARPAPHTAPDGPTPKGVIVEGDLGPAEGLVQLMEDAEIPIQREKSLEDDRAGALILDDVVLRLTDGRMATQVAADEESDKIVLFDLALDYEAATRIALAPADQTAQHAVAAAAGLFQAIGKAVSVIDDVPGMLLMRAIAMLANEAADAVNQGVTDVAGVDTAMMKGVNYPLGPLAWADRIGVDRVRTVLANLGAVYGEDRYRTSPLIHRRVAGGRGFHD